MKKLFVTLTGFVLMSILFFAQAQDLDKILKNHYDAVGQEKLANLKSLSFSGKILQGGMELPFNMYTSRPLKFRMDITVQGQKIVQAFDGEIGWYINPMMGTMDPQDMSPDQIKDMRKQADMDGDLYNYEKKGSTLELVGTEDFEGTEVYKLKLTDKEGDITYYFMDSETFVIIKTTAKRMVQGTEVESESLLSNYQMIDGVAFPFSISTGANGQTMVEIEMDNVDFDTKFEDAFFAKPEKQ
ncbi:MAG: hypothetical protein QNK30_04945 [Bacteroidales bacterium]|nr:hypothetical protein [Bacteroidales bacterium]